MRVRDREQLELLRSLGATRWQMFRMLRIPGSVPYVFAGFHIGIIFAVLGAVVAEFVGSRSGLGYLLLLQKGQFNVPGVFAILVLLMGIGLSLHGVMVALERKLAFWAKDLSNVAV
jgi:NitT/TauT family transport system permease protein